MNFKSQAAIAAIRTQPKTIVDRLLDNPEILAFVDLNVGTYPGIGSFRHEEVVAALQLAADQNDSVSLKTREGVECWLKRTPAGTEATIRREGDEQETSSILRDFDLLDPEPKVRSAAIDLIEKDNPPWLPGIEKWRSILRERPLNEVELEDLTRTLTQNPTQVLRAIDIKWRRGTVTAGDLFPTQMAYYEMLIGPRPTIRSVDDYVTEALRPHHKSVVARDLARGLGFLLPAGIRGDILFADLLHGMDDDAVWEALNGVGELNSPFALLSAFEIACARSERDERFNNYAEAAVKRLVGKKFCGDDEQDAYVLFPPLLRLCLNWISVSADLWATPPYWRRLAAFVHCHFILEILRIREIDPEQLVDWCNQHATQKSATGEFIDMQQEPLWQPSDLSAYSMRAEVLGRLRNFVAEADQKERNVPGREEFDRAIKGLPYFDILPLSFCGPLEGHLRRRTSVNAQWALADSTKEHFQQLISNIKTPDNWIQLNYLSRFFAFDEEILDRLIKAINELDFMEDPEVQRLYFGALTTAAFIAATQPSESINQALADRLIRDADRFKTAEQAERGYRVLLLAAAAYSERGQWLEWLSTKLTDYAFTIPKGEASDRFYQDLAVLCELLPVQDWQFARARKAAASALR